MRCAVTYKKQTHDLNSEGKFNSVTFQRPLKIISFSMYDLTVILG